MPTNDDDQLENQEGIEEMSFEDDDAPSVQDEPTINLTLSDLGDISDENKQDIKQTTGIIDNTNTLNELGDIGGMFDVTSPGVDDVLGSLEESQLIEQSEDSLKESTINFDLGDLPGLDQGGLSDNSETQTPTLTIESLEQQGERFEIPDNSLLQVGREVGDIVINHRSISSQHCSISNQGGIISITDLGSTNGTFINGEKISPRRMVILEESDQILIGQVLVALHMGNNESERMLNQHGDTATVLMENNVEDHDQVHLQEATQTIVEQESVGASFSDLTSELSSVDNEDDSDDMPNADATDLLLLQKQAAIGEAETRRDVTEEFDAEKHLREPEELTQSLAKKVVKKKVRPTSVRDIINADKTDIDIEDSNLEKLKSSKKSQADFYDDEQISLPMMLWTTIGDIITASCFYVLLGKGVDTQKILSDVVAMLTKALTLENLFEISQLAMVEDFLKVYLFYGFYRLVSAFIFGTTFFQLLSGIASEANPLVSRISALVRELITLIIPPLSILNASFRISFSKVAIVSDMRKFISAPVLLLLVIFAVFSPYFTEFINTKEVLVQEMRVVAPNVSDLSKLSDFNSKKLHLITSHLNLSNGLVVFPVHKTISKNKKTIFVPGVSLYSLNRKKGSFLFIDRANPLRSMLRNAVKKGISLSSEYNGVKVLLDSPKKLLAPSSTIELGQRVMDKNIQDAVESFVRDAIMMNQSKLISFATSGNLSFTTLLEFRNILCIEFECSDTSSFYLSNVGDSRFLIIQNQEKQVDNTLLVEYLIPLDSVNGYVYRLETQREASDVITLRDVYKMFLANAQFEFDTVLADAVVSVDKANQINDFGILLDNFAKVDEQQDIKKLFTVYGSAVRQITNTFQNTTDKNFKEHILKTFKMDENYINFLRKQNKNIDNFFTTSGLKPSAVYLDDLVKK